MKEFKRTYGISVIKIVTRLNIMLFVGFLPVGIFELFTSGNKRYLTDPINIIIIFYLFVFAFLFIMNVIIKLFSRNIITLDDYEIAFLEGKNKQNIRLNKITHVTYYPPVLERSHNEPAQLAIYNGERSYIIKRPPYTLRRELKKSLPNAKFVSVKDNTIMFGVILGIIMGFVFLCMRFFG